MARFRVQLNKPWGYVSLEAETVDEIASKVGKLMELSAALERTIGSTTPSAAQGVVPSIWVKRRRGRSEAILALDIIERQLLRSEFFATPRSTSEVRQRIYELTGMKLQSRKVSQALGILFDSKRIMRVGPKGKYKWFVK
ncbi:MAG: hypothetical protein RMJ28_03830 [Nitrososphaerota archaeon]|nr:hypothetical protein [Candidatus Calditenuaceae archaeon]MDW8073351.1 hypothetical protein [Nitrososphaerota archaeon]